MRNGSLTKTILILSIIALGAHNTAQASYVPITVEEQDASPSVFKITRIQVSNSKLTSIENGTVSLNLNGDISATSNFSDNVLIRGDGGAKGIQGSGIIIDDNDNISSIANLTINGFTMATGAASNYVLTSDGSGNATWAAASGASDINGLEDAISNQADSIFIGNGSGLANSGTTYATAVGIGALEANTSGGVSNAAFGYNTLKANTTGDNNTAVGYNSSFNNTTGGYSTAIGAYALYSNTTSGYNTAIGYRSLFSNTTGYENTASGNRSLDSNTTGYRNTAYGYNSLYSNNTGSFNTAYGYHSLLSNTTASDNSAFGYEASQSNSTGAYNTAIGKRTLNFNQTGSYNTALGQDAGYGVSTNSFSNSVLLGYRAGYALSTGSNNIAIGFQAGDNISTGSSNIIIGYNIDAPSPTTSNQLSIGNLIYGTNVDGTTTTPSTGNIGIGKSSPTSKLDVNGSITATAIKLTTGAASNYVLTSDGSGNGSWADITSLITTEWTDGGSFIYPSDDSGAETLIIGATSEVNANIILGANGNVVFNEQANDADFRVEGQSNANMIFGDASTTRVGIKTNSPNSSLHVGGSLTLPITSKTSNYSASEDDYTILVNSSSGAVTISLPSASGITGRLYVIKKTDSSGNLVTLDGNASETVDGYSTYSINTQNQSLTIQSDGSNWQII